jgi:CubicO group peptidase (beta-lactamase class C family)
VIARSIFVLCMFVSCFCLAAPETPHEMSAEDVSAFLDGILPLQLEREDIAGAVVVVVRDGTVLFAKGYGYADAAKRVSVSPENTLFRPGSISKLFTWTSVMQLVEQRKLDLDRDVNDYIDFKIPATFSKPITLRNIMTHTAGFEETAKDLFTETPANIIPLGEYLRNHIPDRIFPPGTVPAYSNYATSLAGYIVSRVSRKPFEQYVEDSIFQPLGMTHSSFKQPLPETIRPLMSKGYKLGSDDPKPFEIVIPYPAGSLSTSGTDMARFMIAHLQDGRYEGVQILRSETAQLMHSRQLSWADELPGMALGFYEESRNGLRIIGHAGDTICFHSDLHLIPEKNMGFYISYNSAGKGEISPRSAVWEKFLNRYFPYEIPNEKVSNPVQHAKELSGHYLTSRRMEGGILHVLSLLEEMTVSPQKDGTLEIDAFKNLNGKPKRWQEIKPFVFREVKGQDLIVFKHPDGSSTPRLITRFPVFVFDKVSWSKNSNFLLILFVSSVAILLLNLILWPVAAWIRRHYGITLGLSLSEKRWRTIVRLICAVNLLFVIGFVVILAQADSNLSILNTKMDFWFHLVQIVGLIGIVSTVFAVYAAYLFVKNSQNGKWLKFQYAAVALGCISFAWFVIQNHLLDFSLRY